MSNYPVFDAYLRTLGIQFEKEVQFAECFGRKWKSDYILTFPKSGIKLAIEIEGGAHTGGRHTRGVGFIKDMQKYNAYTALGYKLLRFTPEQVTNELGMVGDLIMCVGNEIAPKAEIFALKKKAKTKAKVNIKKDTNSKQIRGKSNRNVIT